MSGKLYDSLTLDDSAVSYADLHHEITKSLEDGRLKSCGNHQKQGTCRRESKEDELVRYMSNLPGYLKRGETTHEKALNVGVLDWACLKQWQYSHQPMPISGRSSTSTSNTSFSVSTNRLSGYSSRGRNSSPSCQRICHPSLQSQLMASAMKEHSQDTKSLGKRLENGQNLRGCHIKQEVANEHLSENLSHSRLKSCSRKGLDSKIDVKRVVLSTDEMYGATSCARQGMSTQDCELEKGIDTLRQPNINTVEEDMLMKNKPLVLHLRRHNPQNGHSGVSDMRTSQCQKSQYPSRTSFLENPKELSLSDVNDDKNSNSCTLPYEVNCNHSQAKGCSSTNAESSIKVPSSTFSASIAARMKIISPCRSRKAETKSAPTISSAKGPSQEPTQKVTSDKPRSSSPFRRFSFSTGFTSKGSGCKEDALLPHRSSVGTVMSSSGNMRGCSSSDISGNGKAGDAGRSRSSPLRRLLDPLLKSKAANCHHSAESSKKDSLLINKNLISANGNSSSQKEEELMRDHRVGFSDSSKKEKHASSTVQALLRIAVKNGLPLFTFAVDNNSNILAATVKKLGTTSEKDDCDCIYTFFTFREVNKNGNWMKQAGKCKGPDYIHHVVAQMKVSNSHFFDLTGENCVDSSTVKEFVLYSMKQKQGVDQASDYQPDDELAAIILKIPKISSFFNDVHQSRSCDDGQDHVHATVVLPSGVHSHPSKGGPSSLIERWRSGGSCDCGGWDMGCELKILANEHLAGKKSSSSNACEDHFELFLQVLFVLD